MRRRSQKLIDGCTWAASHLVGLSFGMWLLTSPLLHGYFPFAIEKEDNPLFWLFVSFLWIHPLILTACNLFYLLYPGHTLRIIREGRRMEVLTVVEGSVLSLSLLGIFSIFRYDWWYPGEAHLPVFTGSFPTVISVFCIAVIGYAVIRLMPLQALSPLFAVFCIAAMYLGAALCVLWIVQMAGYPLWVYFSLFPFNCLLIAAKAVKETVRGWAEEQAVAGDSLQRIRRPGGVRFSRLPNRPMHWLWMAVLLALLLLVLLAVILLPFGQPLDSFVQAWTETSDGTLSQRVAPHKPI